MFAMANVIRGPLRKILTPVALKSLVSDLLTSEKHRLCRYSCH